MGGWEIIVYNQQRFSTIKAGNRKCCIRYSRDQDGCQLRSSRSDAALAISTSGTVSNRHRPECESERCAFPAKMSSERISDSDFETSLCDSRNCPSCDLDTHRYAHGVVPKHIRLILRHFVTCIGFLC